MNVGVTGSGLAVITITAGGEVTTIGVEVGTITWVGVELPPLHATIKHNSEIGKRIILAKLLCMTTFPTLNRFQPTNVTLSILVLLCLFYTITINQKGDLQSTLSVLFSTPF